MRIWTGLGLLGAATWLAAAGGPAFPDEKGQAVLREAFKTLSAAKTYSATLAMTIEQPGLPRPISLKGTVIAMKPNLLRVELKQAAGGPGATFAADGKNYYTYIEAAKQYVKQDLDASPKEFAGQWEGEIDAFFGGESLLAKGEPAYAGSEKVGGVDCDQVKVTPKGQGAAVVYSIGKTDHLIHRAVVTVTRMDGMKVMQTTLLTEIKLNGPKKAADFAFSPPEGATEAPREPARP